MSASIVSYSPRSVWVGGITPTSFVIRIQASLGESIVVSTTPGATVGPSDDIYLITNSQIPPGLNSSTSLASFNITGRSPATAYYFGLLQSNVSQKVDLGRAITFPQPGSAFSFIFAAGASARWQELVSSLYDEVLTTSPLFFVSVGNLFYKDRDPTASDRATMVKSYTSMQAQPSQMDFFANIPVNYVYDETDFGGSNSFSGSPAKAAAQWAFDTFYPHYPLLTLEGDQVAYQVFTVGRTRMIITDLRTRSTGPYGDISNRTTMGVAQRNLFLAELANFQQYKLMVWFSSKTWTGASDPTSDQWPGYSTERTIIANRISELGVNNLIMVSGGHSIAVDDGSSTDYSTNNLSGAGFPLLKAGPMSDFGGADGQYTNGCFAYQLYPSYQYGLVSVDDLDNATCVTLEGHVATLSSLTRTVTRCVNTTNASLVRQSSATTAVAPPCQLYIFPVWVWVVISTYIIIGFGILYAMVWKFARAKGWCRSKKYRNAKDPTGPLPIEIANIDAVPEFSSIKDFKF